MSWVMNNLVCHDCDTREFESMYKRADGPPLCPECDQTMSVDLNGLRFAVHGDGPGSFAPVDFGVLGKAETREDYNRCMAQIKERFPGRDVHIEHESSTKKKERLDAIRHRSWAQKKAKGLDASMVKQASTHNKRLKAEGRKTKSAAALAKGE
jgi:hypothetical protein